MDIAKSGTMNYPPFPFKQEQPPGNSWHSEIKQKLQLNGDSDCTSNVIDEIQLNGDHDVNDNDQLESKADTDDNYKECEPMDDKNASETEDKKSCNTDDSDKKDSDSDKKDSDSDKKDSESDKKDSDSDKKDSDSDKKDSDSDKKDDSSSDSSDDDIEPKQKKYMVFSEDDDDDLDNYECGESSASEKAEKDSDYDASDAKSEDDDDDDDNYTDEDSEEEIYHRKSRKNRKKDRYWEGHEEVYGIRRSGRERKNNTRYYDMEDSGAESPNSDDDSAAFFKNKPKKRPGNRGYRHFSESERSEENSDYSPSEENWRRGGSKKKKYRRIKKMASDPVIFRSIRTRRKEVNYRDVEETDPLGSDDEEDVMYQDVADTEPEELVDAIERVLYHRVGPKWQLGDMTALSAGGKGLKSMDDAPQDSEARCPQYYIKWARYSHIHNTWESDVSLEEKKCKGLKRLENYQKRQSEIDIWRRGMTPEDREYYDVQDEMQLNLISQYTQVDRIVTHTTTTDDDGNTSIDYFVKWKGLPYIEATYEKDTYLKEHHAERLEYYEQMKNADTKPLRKAMTARPRFIKTVKQPDWIPEGLFLRDYQVDGLNWLAHSWCKQNSVILADEMGLGKTIETVCFLNYIFYEAKSYGPFLIVVPLSTMPAWEREFAKWAPNMNVISYIGDHQSRLVIQEKEWQMPNGRLKFNAVVTSYEIMLKDMEFFQSFPWAVLSVDEAHRLKNDQSSLYKVLIQFKTYHRLLITGTPLQNSLKELWALLHFIMPHHYPTYEQFEENHGTMNEMNSEALSKIHKELEPYLLRRVKKDVEKSLPKKTEQILRVDMTAQQKQYYKWILTKNFRALNKESKGSQQSFMNILMELKKCCNHCELTVPLDPSHEDQNRLRSIVKGSGKLWLLDKLLARCKEKGSRVLIFSQMVRLLDILSEYLELNKYSHQRLDGGVKGSLRAQALDHFNAEGSQDFCFLLSTRAGGLGINLATADTVIIFDSDWNPQNDLQAMARAHRIGQKKPVKIYRLVTKNSIEEEIIERAKKKMILDHLVIQKMDTSGRTVLQKNNPNKNIPFNKEELSAVLKFGAIDLFKDESTSDQHLEGLDLDTVLQEAETRGQEGEEEGAGHDLLSQFKVANFTIADDEEQGWDAIIPADQVEALEHQETDIPLYIAPRRKKKVNYTGTLTTRRGSSDDDSEGAQKKSKRRKLSAPSHSRKMSEDAFDEASMFTKSEIRRFVKSYRKYGPPMKRLRDIGKDAQLSASLPELEALANCIHRKCLEAEEYATNLDGTQKKGTTILVGECTFPTTHITHREAMLNNLEMIPTNSRERMAWRIDKRTKPAGWDVEWGGEEDSLLLIGVQEHGLGNWGSLMKDTKLQHITQKIFLEGDEKPKVEHLHTRAEYLLKNLSKLASPAAKSTKKKKKKKKKEDIRKFYEGDDEPQGSSSSKKKKKSQRIKKSRVCSSAIVEEGEVEEAEATPDVQWSDAVFKKCKEMMRPVRKTLRLLENPNDETGKEEQLRQTKGYLLTIGQQIEENCKGKQEHWVKEWTENLWVFVSQFTPIGAKQLKKLYKKAVKQSQGSTKPSRKRKR